MLLKPWGGLDERIRMKERELRELVSLPTMNTRRPDGISSIDVMSLLDAATQVVSKKYPDLGCKMRRELYAAIDAPSAETWDNVFDLPVMRPGDSKPAQLLWSLVLAYTPYEISHHRKGESWPEWPTGAELVLALSSYLGPAHPDPRELF